RIARGRERQLQSDFGDWIGFIHHVGDNNYRYTGWNVHGDHHRNQGKPGAFNHGNAGSESSAGPGLHHFRLADQYHGASRHNRPNDSNDWRPEWVCGDGKPERERTRPARHTYVQPDFGHRVGNVNSISEGEVQCYARDRHSDQHRHQRQSESLDKFDAGDPVTLATQLANTGPAKGAGVVFWGMDYKINCRWPVETLRLVFRLRPCWRRSPCNSATRPGSNC